mmetsp:Transcript_5719/g.16034  ORF Transcript_5719/g.16034 Transcript_5719/m.16034 type:complete len:275 (-) Transcript_5719:4613-5437(-)
MEVASSFSRSLPSPNNRLRGSMAPATTTSPQAALSTARASSASSVERRACLRWSPLAASELSIATSTSAPPQLMMADLPCSVAASTATESAASTCKRSLSAVGSALMPSCRIAIRAAAPPASSTRGASPGCRERRHTTCAASCAPAWKRSAPSVLSQPTSAARTSGPPSASVLSTTTLDSTLAATSQLAAPLPLVSRPAMSSIPRAPKISARCSALPLWQSISTMLSTASSSVSLLLAGSCRMANSTGAASTDRSAAQPSGTRAMQRRAFVAQS